MALTIDEAWIRERVKLKHDHLDDVKSLSLPGTYQEKITLLGNSLRSFTRLKNLDLSRNSITSIEGLEVLQMLENLNLYYNNISTIRDLSALRHLNNLKELDLRLNPVTKNEPDYRLHIVHMLPNLKRLDDRSVRDSERRAALMHFTSDQASDFNDNKVYPNKSENERISVPRSDMIRNLGPRNTVFEEDDIAILDMITRTGGDLSQPRRITGSSSRQPDLEDFNKDEIHNMEPYGTPRKHRHDDIMNKKNKSPRNKDRVYVQFADDVKTQHDDILKYRDETTAYSTLNTRGHFTPNPIVNGQTDVQGIQQPIERTLPPSKTHRQSHDTGRTFDYFSPEKNIHRAINENDNQEEYDRSRQTWTSPRQSQGPLADKIGQERVNIIEDDTHVDDRVKDSSEVLNNLLDLVDRYWNGSKSLHRHPKFQSLARKLIPSADQSFQQHSSSGTSEKLRMELSERTGELSRLRDQMVEQQRELESLRNKVKTHDMMQDNLQDTVKELTTVRTKLREVEEQNMILKAKASSLEARNMNATEQEKQLGELIKRNSSLEDKVQSFTSQMAQQDKNLQQLQELTDMLQESHRSLVATNDHLLRELDETRQRHSTEVQQMHWSYDKLKNSMDWLPNGNR